MKYIFVTMVAVLAFTFTAGAQNQIDKQGRKQGHWVRADKNGVKIFEADYKDGLETGTSLYYYSSGALRIRNVYSVPGRYCSHEAFDEKGHLLAKGYYNQKNRDSVWHIYNEEGKLVKIATYKMGVKHGPHIIFTSAGDTAEYAMWHDNHRDGRWWKRIGEKGYITGTYVKGSLEGTLVEYDNQGNMVRKGNYLNGDKHGSYQYFEGKTLTIDEKWNHGVLENRNILLSTPNPTYVSVGSIAYFYAKGTQAVVVLFDGKNVKVNENVQTLHARTGSDLFQLLDVKQHIVANVNCVQGLTTDEEGREVLSLDPPLPFSIFPDEDCIRMVKSLMREDVLDE